MKRRDFFRTSLLASSGVLFVDSFLGCVHPAIREGDLDQLFKGFQEPPASSRVFVRWWWNGNRLDADEILRELEVMKEAGIGGVEINPIAFPGYEDPMGYESLTIFTEPWLDMLEVALKGAKERGIICDMIVGSGWPFGGEFLKKEEQSQMVTIETIDLEGKALHHFSVEELLNRIDPEIHSKNDKVYRDLLMMRLLPARSDDFVEGEDLMPRISGDELSFTTPDGHWVLYYVAKLTGYMAVINGSPGAAGPVLNHYSAEATEAYLNRISDFITGKIGDMGSYIRAMFCDSMELEGANWNDDLLEEFEARRGYSLRPYFPFVLKKVGHMGNPLDEEYGTRFSEEVVQMLKRVELDFYRTRIELFRERFIETFNQWCHKNNVLSRMQAYGRGMHPLEASMAIDIPECETWLFKEVGREYPNTGPRGRAPLMCNKYVASGALLAGKKVVSCEEITNTSMAFMATLENIKVAGDQSNLSGVNHSILHGYNYSPLDVPFPGWIRYGTYFNERNTWWPYFRLWSDYKARISYLLQNASPRANVAILQPLTDLWLKEGPQRDPFPQKRYPEYQHNLWEVIHQNGGGCDYVSESIIRSSEMQNGSMNYGDRSYEVLLLPEIETLDAGTAMALKDFAATGGRVVFIGKQANKSAAYLEMDEEDAKVRTIVEDMIGQSEGRVFVYPAPGADLITWYGELQKKLGLEPFVRFSEPSIHLNQCSYQVGGHPLYFIANHSLSEEISVRADFRVDSRLIPWQWDPESGEKYPCVTTGSNNNLEIHLPRAASMLIVFEEEQETEEEVRKSELFSGGGSVLSGPWMLQLKHVNGEEFEQSLAELANLADTDWGLHFAGTVIYEKTIQMEGELPHFIDLGDVQGVTEVFLNGTFLGTRWYGAQRFDVGSAAKKGENLLSIKLTTITGNYLKGLKDHKVAQRWTSHQDYYPVGILGPVSIL